MKACRARSSNTPGVTGLLAWAEPLDAASALTRNEDCWALLYSGQQLEHTGRYSHLGLYPQEIIKGSNFTELAKALAGKAQESWFGYFSYELLHELETLPIESHCHIALPALWFARFGLVLRFDHEQKTVRFRAGPGIALPAWPPRVPAAAPSPPVRSLTSPMTRQAYLALVAETREAIVRGDFYQANITRKFTGEFSGEPDALALFAKLCRASPGAYSACLKLENHAILSSSPERFLTIAADGHMDSRPIKGTAARHADAALDAHAREALTMSEKDRAENLMIVDLMRNDLARSAEPGSVKVERLFEVSTYATLHHMASTVTGQKRPQVSTLEAVKRSFPPGSMTGAPKIRAMEWCLKHEGITRGVYSGALGWFGGDGSCDLSVVIRTLVLQGKRFEFQVGGGIVADSEPEAEWRETLTKARGIAKALGVEMGKLERI